MNHVDNTGRLQTVARDENPLYYDLIQTFGKKTGIPVILNTSFNENEPIVCTPQEADRLLPANEDGRARHRAFLRVQVRKLT